MSGTGHSETLSTGWSILLVEDDSVIARTTEILFRLAGHHLDVAAGPSDAFSLLGRRHYDLILLDMNFTAGQTGGDEGLACIERILSEDPTARVIVITAHSGIRIAVAAMQAGAKDFLMKPWRKDELLSKCAAVMAKDTLAVAAPIRPSGVGSGILGESAAMVEVRALVRRIGPTVANVCVSGRSGSGRTLIATAIHAASADAGTSLISIDLRDRDQWGLLDSPSGTVLLRHSDRLEPVAQGRLLDRLLPGLRCISIVDSVEALGPPLRRRLCTIEVDVPPLSARRNDAVLLARHFAALAGETYGHAVIQLTPAAEAVIAVTNWPDEVRGLFAAVERAVLLSDSGLIDAAAIQPAAAASAPRGATDTPVFGLEDAEKLMIKAALTEHRHNISRAATALGISRGTLYRRMAQHGL